ncbi:hypothetical protein KFK09_014696 [Dendrobium nobile]|uniref:BHLH domain-containing protein n=1 Tax=Dendrobium nobile TaxID=94219 RepID=A0A8T3B448_DENNO|nr:hypothetical protein KFK09_014696 [Dendrobium nobile]
MEPEGVASESSWSSFNSTMATKESELLAQFLGIPTFSTELEHEPSMFMQSLLWSDHGIDPYYGSQYVNTNMCYWPMENSCNFTSLSNSNKHISEYESYYSNMEPNMMSTIGIRSEPILLCMEEDNINTASYKTNRRHHFDDKNFMNDGEDIGGIKKSQGKRKIQVCDSAVDSINIQSSYKKRIRASWQEEKSSGKSSKSKKADVNVEVMEEEVDNASAHIVQSSSCYISEDEANTSQELNGGDGTSASTSLNGSMVSLNSNGKKRACRGSATDPQSLYARKRRERINERLKILQNLIPNGTKVDINTMLEEAVQYVKFLQVQIKLLSSDELWMYAPIAYNGINIDLDLKMSPLKIV